ncbi:MAG TPA: alpha/beta fold hydrolase [Dehalococcoidia bacterium]|nr:alpha/beta fold hydrolase [Dehalococcoidia bacterium]
MALPSRHHMPVLLIPGLMAGDWAMRPLSTHLRRRGFTTVHAGIGLNIGCTTELLDRLEARLEVTVREHGERAAVVGHSRGGTLAKLLVQRRPRDVAGLVALASPNVDPLAVSRSVLWQLRTLNRLSAAGFRGLLAADCLSGACAESALRELQRPLPRDVPYVLLYSKTDGVVDWQACHDPDADLIELRGSHMQMAISPDVRRIVTAALIRMERDAETPALRAG